MDIFAKIKLIIVKALNEINIKDENFIVETPKEKTHGDFATNVALSLFAKHKNQFSSPRNFAQKIVEVLKTNESFTKLEIAGAGFINICVSQNMWNEALEDIISKKLTFGKNNLGKGQKINVEFVSANPTGPMHIGHARGACVGDSISRILAKCGYRVTREFYINDAGGQVDVLAKSVYLRYLEANGKDIGPIPAGLYPGEYLKPVAKKLAKKYGSLLKEGDERIKKFSLSQMLILVKKDLEKLGVKHNVFSSEQKIRDSGKLEDAISHLKKLGLVYTGKLEAPKGKEVENYEQENLLLFKSTLFGDDQDRALKKQTGDYTYFAPDVAYHFDKYKRGFKKMILELGADHRGYISRLKAAVKGLSGGKANLEIVIHELVNLYENGQVVKMSKRAGTFFTLADLIKAVGKDAVRFIMLTRKSDQMLDFDLKKTLSATNENPIFYVQYASSRMHSVIRKTKSLKLPKADFSLINSPVEIELIKTLVSFPKILKAACDGLEPHLITYYTIELAAKFHSLWNAGKDDPSLHFIQENNLPLTASRISLIKASLYTLKSTLNLLGVTAVKRM
jgi:arginyl-tRNA synthetase